MVDRGRNRARLTGVLALAAAMLLALLLAACGGSSSPVADATEDTEDREDTEDTVAETTSSVAADSVSSPGGYDFDRSDPEAGIANIMAAFATDRETAECIYQAWGDVANVAPEELTPELMTFPVCGTSIFQLMTGDARFTGNQTADGQTAGEG